MARYRLTVQAEIDLIRLHQWGARRFGEAQADAYFLGLIEQYQKIADEPLLYPSAAEIREGYRRCVFRGRDSIFYRLDDDVVEIVTIIGRQDLEGWL